MEKSDYSKEAHSFIEEQKINWPLASDNFKALSGVMVRNLNVFGEQIKVQFNPARIVSSAAKIDSKSISERPCFLCSKNSPAEQGRMDIHDKYWLLCNPFPIFTEHFTIPSRIHEAQSIYDHFTEMMELSALLSDYTLFYNGPRCGASAPDHLHFQAVTFGQMPLDIEVNKSLDNSSLPVICKNDKAVLYHYLSDSRSGFAIEAKDIESALSLFHTLYNVLPCEEGETEPKMNVFSYFKGEVWRILVMPRKLHRPRQYFLEDDGKILTSPGAADIGGLFITPRKEDFDKLTSEILEDIYSQVCYNSLEIKSILQ